MKYYSEVLDEFFDDADTLLKKETVHLAKIAKEEEALAKKKSQESARKKELANVINDCDEAVDIAYKNLKNVKLKCTEILKEADKTVAELLKPAESQLKEAQANRIKAIQNFNKEFGVFKTTYTNERAQRELQNTIDMFNSIWDMMF